MGRKTKQLKIISKRDLTSPSQVQIRDSNLIPKGQTICIQKAFTEHLLYTRHFSKHERQKWGGGGKLSPFPHGNLNLGERETIHTTRNAVRIMNNEAQEGNGAYHDKGSCFKKIRDFPHHPHPHPTSCLILPISLLTSQHFHSFLDFCQAMSPSSSCKDWPCTWVFRKLSFQND